MSEPTGVPGNFLNNPSDDDATVLDSLVTSETWDAEVSEEVDAERPTFNLVLRPPAPSALPPHVRMDTYTANLPASTPYMLTAENNFRQSVEVYATSDTVLRVGETGTAAAGATTGATVLINAGDPVTFTGTRDLWIFNTGTETVQLGIISYVKMDGGAR